MKPISATQFIRRVIKKSELGQPFRLLPFQEQILDLAFAFDENGRLPYDTVIYSCPKKSGSLPIETYAQTLRNLTEATEALYSALINRNLRLYRAPDLRQYVLNAVSVETPRGIRLSKQKTSNKIDAAVALSFAVLAAIQHGKIPVPSDSDRNEQAAAQKWDARFSWTFGH